ncbi:MAG: 6-phosphogluconolactonase [Thermoleophilia bacterium]
MPASSDAAGGPALPDPGSRCGVVVVRDPAQLAEKAAALFAREARAAVRARGRFLVGLSGGSTPGSLYRFLAGPAADRLPWDATHLLWGDERCVPPEDERSNFALVERSGLLARTLAGCHRMRGEDPPEAAAAAYEVVLTDLAGVAPRRSAVDVAPAPALDLILIGLGEDGHTASLFPGSPALLETRRAVVVTEEHAGLRRLTLTLSTLWSARRVVFLVAGEGKREAAYRVLRLRDPRLPATLVTEGAGWVRWLIDEAAAGAGEDSVRC